MLYVWYTATSVTANSASQVPDIKKKIEIVNNCTVSIIMKYDRVCV